MIHLVLHYMHRHCFVNTWQPIIVSIVWHDNIVCCSIESTLLNSLTRRAAKFRVIHSHPVMWMSWLCIVVGWPILKTAHWLLVHSVDLARTTRKCRDKHGNDPASMNSNALRMWPTRISGTTRITDGIIVVAIEDLTSKSDMQRTWTFELPNFAETGNNTAYHGASANVFTEGWERRTHSTNRSENLFRWSP